MNKGNWSETFGCLENKEFSCRHSQGKMATRLSERFSQRKIHRSRQVTPSPHGFSEKKRVEPLQDEVFRIPNIKG